MRTEERIPAVISGARSEYDNCSCDMCHGLGYVAKVKYPITGYSRKDRYKTLRQAEHTIWICDECRRKLIDILLACEEGGNP